MLNRIHPVAGALALFLICSFWLATALSEAFGSRELVVSVKSAIPWGFLLLVPTLAVVSGSGFASAKGRRGGLIGAKLKRMPITAANGVFVLIPAALFLAAKARADQFDTGFYAVQAIELLAGFINMSLLGLNMRDGFKMKGRFRKGPQRA